MVIRGNNFRIKIDNQLKRLILCVYDLNSNLIEEQTYIDYDTIKTRLELKLSNLAIVYASKRVIDNHKCFRYYQITIYKLKSFETFIKLLEQDIIKTSIVGRVARSGIEEGRQRNKNIIFSIPKEQIDLLFDTEFDYNCDSDNG